MSYKITRRDEASAYHPNKHFDMRAMRIHNADEVNDGTVTFGISHFLPGGGCEYGANAKESIYYILEGAMELTAEQGTEQEVVTVLHKGDSFHCGPGTYKGIINKSCVVAQMLTIIVSVGS